MKLFSYLTKLFETIDSIFWHIKFSNIVEYYNKKFKLTNII